MNENIKKAWLLVSSISDEPLDKSLLSGSDVFTMDTFNLISLKLLPP